MPEQLTKHPEVTLEVLRSAGAQCGTGAAQAILTACPAARFCKLPGGEICVYDVANAARMTQFAPADWQALVQALPHALAASGGASGAAATPPAIPGPALSVGLVLLGGAIGWMLRRGR